ncbi:MAG: SpoIIE family protein phosphatase [Desulfobacula sp.]|uniref:SpoIIE family protein phosphatase n=1 Tax=Desulfobacula sp. TaxID=2593537 RepID=UPI0025C1E064|nr:SpoIIE family protein phosphatase [Desulfobacula sp.]MCD4719070.1 SpoIIE family protein phosphatase [Desulfobacula sp.]
MEKKYHFYNSIFTQSVLIVIGFTLVSLVLSGYLFQQSMKKVAMKEVENKATIFLSAMETSVRRFVTNRESKRLTELIEERAKFLESNLNFTIIRVVVQDPQGQILDHTRPEKIGQTHSTGDFQKVITSGRPLIKREIKTLKLESGKPDIPVIEIIFPISNRIGDIVATVKIILDVRRTFELIHKEYWRLNTRVFLGFGLVAVLLVIGTLFFLSRRIITPVLSVVKGSAMVASGDLEIHLVPRGKDEISNLIHSFNQMVEGLKQRDQMRQSLEIAMEVQQNLLPKYDPDFEGLDIAGKSIYCDETGGDYYDFFEFDENRAGKIGIVLGDVSGHGISSALLMATARAFLHQRLALPGTISQVISDINRQLARDVVDSGSFMTMFYMIFDKACKSVKWVRAGHDPAIFYDPKTDKISQLKGAGIALGVDENWQYGENEKQNLANGQIIVLGSDGIWEARNPKGEMFGKEPIYTIIRETANLDAKSILNTIIESLIKFQDNVNVEDDITLVVIKILPQF